MLTIGLLAAVLGAGPRPVVVTTDCGAAHDDQWAIVHLALSPAADLKGIVTNHAPNLDPPAASSSAKAARALLERLPADRRPRVVEGSSTKLDAADRPRRNAGVDFLLAQAEGRSAGDRLAVVVIGAATDVASALLIDPSWADRVEIVAMGFDRWPEGGDPWNVKNDPAAWRVVLASRVPIVVGDDRVCRRDLALTPEAARRRGLDRGPAGEELLRLLESAAMRHGAGEEPWPVWDEVTTAYLLGLARSESYPRPALGDDLRFDHTRRRGTIRWITGVDSAALWRDLADRLPR